MLEFLPKNRNKCVYDILCSSCKISSHYDNVICVFFKLVSNVAGTEEKWEANFCLIIIIDLVTTRNK